MSGKRVFLFLQGPLSPFFERLGQALAARGHGVLRINLCAGDRLLWRALPATNYTGTAEAWPDFVDAFIARHGVTDLLFLGDRRPLHKAAADKARARGVMVVAVELGYIRPDWLTVERNGMSTWSHFPNDPARIRLIAAQVPPPDLAERFHTSFFTLAYWDVAYNFANVFGGRLHPHYRWHAIYHPLSEYVGWVRRLAMGPVLKRRRQAALARVYADPSPWYLFPLQLATDYQLRDHSPFASQEDALALAIRSFARHAPAGSQLVFKVHPLDNGLVDWHGYIERTAREAGVGDRVFSFEGGKLNKLVDLCRGVITINSTVGTIAILRGRPLIVLGTAVFDVAGLTFQHGLDRFWSEADIPDKRLAEDFIRALAGSIQVKGGFYADDAITTAIVTLVPRLEARAINVPDAFVDPAPRLAGKKHAYSGVV